MQLKRLTTNSLFLEHDKLVHLYVGHVDFLALFDYIRMFAHHQPTNVREEKSARSIVRVPVCVAVLVMLSMVSDPNVQTVLRKNTICNVLTIFFFFYKNKNSRTTLRLNINKLLKTHLSCDGLSKHQQKSYPIVTLESSVRVEPMSTHRDGKSASASNYYR